METIKSVDASNEKTAEEKVESQLDEIIKLIREINDILKKSQKISQKY